MPASPEFALACSEFLHRDGRPLYALLDAARDPGVRAFIAEQALESKCLYAGFDPDLADVGPYLVHLQPHQTAALVALAWGDSWGVFFRSDADLDTLRRHFRKFLLVQFESGEEVYFRFYDPRVLRVFPPTCTDEEWRDFIGPVAEFLLESDESTEVLRFDASHSRDILKETLR